MLEECPRRHFCLTEVVRNICDLVPVHVSSLTNAVKPTSTCLSLLGMQLFGRPLLLGLPQVTGDGDGVHAGRHGFGWYLAELLPV